jgi:hypothetical protein
MARARPPIPEPMMAIETAGLTDPMFSASGIMSEYCCGDYFLIILN